MKKIVDAGGGATILGAGALGPGQLALALARAPFLVAADGGADHALALGHRPRAVIGDMDSIDATTRAGGGAIPADRIYRVCEQDSTDFEKCLYSVSASFFLALGVAGGRMDHGLAALNALVRYRQERVLVLSGEDVIFHAPRELRLHLPVGSRLSLFPLARLEGSSRGLVWPIDGIVMAPGGRIGTSNRVSAPEVRLRFSGDGMLVILPQAGLDAALAALGVAAGV